MKQLIFATLALFFLAGVTFWVLEQKPEVSPDVLKKMKMVSRFKQTLPIAEAGDAQAQYELALMYEIGDGTKIDTKQTLKWLLKAAEQGHAESRYKLGWMYANGIIVRQDFFLAAKYYRLAATFNNHADAQFRLGELHFNGRGVDHDYGKAISYYTQAASKGHAAAQYILSSMYEEGWGVKRDLISAYIWLKLASSKRDEAMAVNKKFDPVQKMARLKPKMNQYQIGEAEKRMREMAAAKR
ncbi:tetratricopeptide repeat protein [Magnetovibrio sp.]|uniref:tetratricopeptide repeat protein n=1 Tax=Magnetovibrio sp. TaxID=2024836 RepID=UPI002F94688A